MAGRVLFCGGSVCVWLFRPEHSGYPSYLPVLFVSIAESLVESGKFRACSDNGVLMLVDWCDCRTFLGWSSASWVWF